MHSEGEINPGNRMISVQPDLGLVLKAVRNGRFSGSGIQWQRLMSMVR